MAFKFKSSGVKIDSPQIQNVRVESTPVGIKTPMELGTNRSGIFAMNFDVGDQISECVQKYMPFIDLESFSAAPDPSGSTGGLTKVDIRITYSVPKLSISKKQIIVSIYANG